MNALIKEKPAAGAVYARVNDPTPKKDELLLRVHRASICGSDLPIYHWNSWAASHLKTPLVFGHEFCGEVIEAGSEAEEFQKGDFVSVESHVYCGECPQCRLGQKHVCQNVKTIGINVPGGFGEFAVIPARCAWKHRDDSLKEIGSLFEPFGNAVYAALAEPIDGATVLITGLGPQGLFAAAVAKACGAERVVAVESSKYRAKLAGRTGVDAVIDPATSDLKGAVLKAGKAAHGFDAVLEMSGAPQAIGLAFSAVRKGGRISAFGLPSRKIEVDWAEDVIFKGVRIYGIFGRLIFDTWKKADELLRSGKVDLSPVVTHRFPMKEFEKAFAVMSAPEKKCGKVILIP